VDFGVEECDPLSVRGEGVGVGVLAALDECVDTHPGQVVAHRSSRGEPRFRNAETGRFGGASSPALGPTPITGSTVHVDGLLHRYHSHFRTHCRCHQNDDNGRKFINELLVRWCTDQKVIFTWPRRGNKNDGAHVAQKNWPRVRALFDYYGDDTAGELAKLNEIWALDALFTNYLLPRQKLLLEQRNGAKLTNREDKAMTDCPSRRADDRIREASRTENTRSSEGIGQDRQLNIVVSPAWLRRQPALRGPRGRLDWWQRVAEMVGVRPLLSASA